MSLTIDCMILKKNYLHFTKYRNTFDTFYKNIEIM